MVNERERLYNSLFGFCDPIPDAAAVVGGLRHYNNSDAKCAEELWDSVRAIASKKMHYLTILFREVLLDPHHWPNRRPFSFALAYPDAVGGHGETALSAAGFQATKEFLKIPSDAEYVKHIIAKHDGEARLWGHAEWVPVPADADIHNARFWHPQFASTDAGRDYLQWCQQRRGQHNGRLSDAELAEIVHLERAETRLLKNDPPFSGKWLIRKGQYITLAELFHYGAALCSCFRLYRMYLALPLFITKKRHSQSRSENGAKRANAKRLHHAEAGRYGLRPGPCWSRG